MTNDELNALEASLTAELAVVAGADIIPLAEAAEQDGQDTSQKIESGFSDLDDCMDGGFREGDFTIISGVPGDGKRPCAACSP